MKCHKITAHLKSGLVISDPWSPSIDSILAYFQIKKDIGTTDFNISTAMGEQTTCGTLPMEKTFYKDLWWYQCSIPEYDCQHEIKRQLYKKFNVEYARMIEKKVKNIELKKNQFKNYSLFFMQCLVSEISWHVVCDINKVRELLEGCKQIGAERGKGMGLVDNWSFKDGEIKNATLNRFIPKKYAEENNIKGLKIFRGFRPSFRIRENQAICVLKKD